MKHAEEIYQAALSADVLLYLKDGQLAYKAPPGGVPEALKQRVLQHKAELVQFLGAEAGRGSRSRAALPPMARAVDRTVVSRAQQRVWLAEQQSGAGGRFNIQGCFAFDGELDYGHFERALGHLLDRHEVLRTRFAQVAGELQARVQDRYDTPLTRTDLSELSQHDQAARVGAIITQDLHAPFDLAMDVLLRVSLLRLGPLRHVAIFNMHHIASDGWSVGLLIEEFCRAYAAHATGAGMPETPQALQYADFAAWQEGHLHGEVLDSGLAFWKTYLEGVPEVHSLPIDKQRPAQQTFAGQAHCTATGPELARRIRAYCLDRKVTLFMFMETALSLALSLYGSEPDIVVGTPVAGRSQPETESMVGLFLNTVVLRSRVDHSKSFDELLQANRANILSAFDHQHVPLELVLEQLAHRRSSSYSPLFQVWFVLQNNQAVELGLPGCRVSEYTQLPAPAAKHELNLYATEVGEDIQLEWVFNTDVFEQDSVGYVAGEFLRLLECIVMSPGEGCLSHGMFPAQAAYSTLVPIPEPVLALTGGSPSLPDRVMEHAAVQPGAAAVVTDAGSFSYAELVQLSERYATAMGRSGTSGQVGLLMARGVDVVAAMLAALKLGRTYVSLDPGYPAARLSYMVGHAGCDLIVCDAAHLELAERLSGGVRIIRGGDEALPEETCAFPAADNDVAYILYTSGSTGQPKGVFQSHAGLAYHAGSYVHALGLSREDRVLQLASYSFDASVLDTYGALLAGASLHLADVKAMPRERMLRLIQEQGITVYHSTPTVFKYLFSDAPAEAAAHIRLVVLGGEAVDPHTMRIFRRIFSDRCRMVGLYGATESSLTTLCEVTPAQIDAQLRPSLGQPISGTQVVVRRDDGELARVFEPGQIAIRSRHLAQGYWNDPELTARKFLPAGQGVREYLTGDGGYLLPDGSVRFVGRQDFQTKLNGIRIELGEIESVLRQLDDVAQAVVVIRGAGSDEAVLVAYVVSPRVAEAGDPAHQAENDEAMRRQGQAAEDYRAHLRQWLPDYMVPGMFVFLDQLPQTPSGKVDRRCLPEPPMGASSSMPLAPRDALEQRLCDAWKRVLALDVVGVEDDFFRLGGHSLKAMRLLALVQEELGVEITLREFFAAPSVAGCADLIRRGRGAERTQELQVVVEADLQNRHAPFPLTLIQQAYWLGRSDIFELGNVSTQSYVEAIVQDLSVERLSRAFNTLIARHEMLRAVFTDAGEQQILPRVPDYQIQVLDLRAETAQAIDAATTRLREEMASQVLAIDTWPIFDLRVSLLPEGAGRLHIVTDAITLDARSRSILARELSALYDNPGQTLPELTLSYRDYVVAGQGVAETQAYAASRHYWLERLDALPGAPNLPMAASPAQATQRLARRWTLDLDPARWACLKTKAASHRLTPANIVLTAFAEVLALWSKGGRFCLNLTLFNRRRVHEQVDHIVGDFTSSMLLEVDMDAESRFASQAARIRDQLWQDMEHRHFAGIEVLRELNSRRSMVSAQMPVVFTSTIGLNDEAQSDQATFVISDEAGASRSRTSQVSLDCQVAERNGGASIVWNGVESLFPPDMLDDMFGVFRARVLEIAGAPGEALPEASIVLPGPHRARRDATNMTAVARPVALLHQLFAGQVDRYADKSAVAWRDGSISYAELDQLSTALAHRLRDRGVRVNELVAVVAHKGWEQVVAVLAVLKAGAAYLPIDPDLPLQRRNQLFEQAQVNVALTQTRLAHELEWPESVACIAVIRDELARGDTGALSDLQHESDLAYVIFTSGSTGVPKGVMIDHRGAVNTVLDINQRFGVSDRDAVLALSALNFDLSVYDIFGLLAVGGTIVFPDAADERDPLEWTRLVEAHGVTIWNTVPALAQMWIDSLDDHDAAARAPIRVVMMSGDWIPTGLPNRIRARLPSAELYSLGGATEASIWSIVYPIEEVDPRWSSIPYGKPMENQSFRVLRPDFRDCPEWVPGDLYIGGIGLAKGYWKDAGKTNAAFVTCPISGERLYKTGDLGRYLPDGNIEFLGREDNQVKVNGYRIELGDIEAAMVQHPKVKVAIAAAVGERNRKQLVAYVLLEDATRAQLLGDSLALDRLSAEVQQLVREQLPSYMLPAAFVLLDQIPLTANGKVDRNALPIPELSREAGRGYQAPTNAVEAALCEMWQQLLHVDQVGIEDNFFELGGDSLLASRAVGMARTRFDLGEKLKIRSFFESPTVASVAAQVSMQLERISLEQTLRSLSGAQEEVEEGLI